MNHNHFEPPLACDCRCPMCHAELDGTERPKGICADCADVLGL